MAEVINLSIEEDLAIISFNNPPVNSLGLAVRKGLVEALNAAENNVNVRAIILIGEGSTFPAGADIKEFAKLDNRADPDFIEAKGYVYVGNSRENLSMENMPSHDDILSFSNELAPQVNREVLSESRPSRVALIGREIVPIPIPEAEMFFPSDLGIAPPVKKLPIFQN